MIPALSCVNGTKPFGIMDNDAISPDKRYFTPSKCVQNGGKDEADNANLPFYKTNKNLFTSPPLVVRNDSELKSPKSFIQQRVERLYGPGALAQGFYSPKRTNSDSKSSVLTERSPNQNNIQSKLFKTNYSNGTSDIGDTNGSANSNLSENYQILDEQSLPVLRHLRPEFRAQLPMLSPKRSPCKPIAIAIKHDMKAPSATTTILSPSATTTVPSTTPSIVNTKVIVTPPAGEIDASSLCDDNQNTSSASSLANGATIVSETVKSVNDMTLSESNGSNGTDMNSSTSAPAFPVANGDRLTIKKDGNYFLNVINVERERLLGLALQVEKDTEMLLESGISSDEEIIGSLRSASGKARLLVSQKIQQFEGLCHNSLNQKPGEKYPTTSEDLQGFWDMVLLQVDHVDSLFQEMDAYRSNNWKKPPDTAKPTLITAKTTSKRPLTTKSIFGNSYSSKSLPMSMSSERANAVAGTQQIISSNKQKSAASIAAAQRRELQRKQLLELKRKNKMLNSEKQQHEPDIDICIDKNSYTS